MTKKAIATDKAPQAVGPYSQGIASGDLIFVSGQVGIDPVSGKHPEGIEAQTEQAMRVHITLPSKVVKDLDRRVGARRRSSFIAHAVEHALEDQQRWELIESSLGAIKDRGHEWDAGPARWVRGQRRADAKRVG